MYSIYCDGVCIHNDRALSNAYKVINPKLTMTDNAAGSLEMTIPTTNAGYSLIERLSSEIIVKRDDEEIWSGRVITEDGNYWNQRVLTCEGELAYLNDTHQEPSEYTEIDTGDFLEAVLEFHNSKVSGTKIFKMGAITVHETLSCTTNYETTLESINTNLIEKFGGHIVIRKENGIRYVDYLADYPNTNAQTIQFGKNLVDFTKNWDMTSYATVTIPRGARLEDSPIEGLEAYTTVESVNAGSIYVTDEDAIKERGWIEAVIDFEDISDPSELLEKAKAYITDTQFENLIIQVSAVDLHYLSNSVEPIKLLDQVQCVSSPHGLDKIFPVSELSIPLDHPENATYTLGSTLQTTLTASNKKTNSEIMEKIENLPSKETILKKAAENAAEIMNQATNGYITITKVKNDNQTVTESLFITDTKDYTKATKAWRWNINGLAYYKTSDASRYPINYNTTTPKIAITMDGAIVADFITTGTMKADRVRAGILESSDSNKNVVFDLDNGSLTVKSGEIKLGTPDSTGYCPFEVDNYGNLHAYRGKIGAFTLTDWAIYSNEMYLEDDGIYWYRDGDFIGKQGTNVWSQKESAIGLTFDLSPNGYTIWWAAKMYTSDDYYTVKLMYTKKKLTWTDEDDNVVIYPKDCLNICCNSKFHYWDVNELWLDPDNDCGVNNGLTLEDGEIVKIQLLDGSYFKCKIVNGFILGA